MGHASTLSTTRRMSSLALAGAATWTLALAPPPPTATASKLPALADRAWEALGGGPSDLTFPPTWAGVWEVTSVLVRVDTPLGSEAVPDIAPVRRALSEDLNKPIRYQVSGRPLGG